MTATEWRQVPPPPWAREHPAPVAEFRHPLEVRRELSGPPADGDPLGLTEHQREMATFWRVLRGIGLVR